MKKLVIGLVALLIIVGGGFFGVIQYGRYRAHSEVEAAFSALRVSGRQATHGPVGYELWSRTLTVPDIAIREKDGASLTIASLIAAGIGQPKDGRIAARSITANAVAIEVPDSVSSTKAAYALPSVKIEDYEGPATLLPQDGTGSTAAFALALRQLAALSAASITAPEATASITPTGAGATIPATSVTYTNLKAEGLAKGRVKAIGFDRMSLETTAPAAAPDQGLKGRLDGFLASDIDTAPLLALTEKKPPPAGVATIYGRVIAKGYALAHGDGSTLAVGEMLAENLGFDPSMLSLEQIDQLRTLSQRGDALKPEEAARLYRATADLAKAGAFTTFAMKDIVVTDPLGKAKVGAITLSDFKGGRIASFTIDKLSGESTGQKPVSLDQILLRGLALPPMLEMSAKSASDGAVSTLDAALGLFRALDGIELSGLTAGREDSDVPVTIQSFKLNWSQLIGMVPTRIALKGTGISGPVSEADLLPLGYLGSAGVTQATADIEYVLAYDPAARTVSLSPATVRVEKAFAVGLEMQVTQVQSRAFEDPIAALDAAQQIGVGPMKLVVTNLGIADLILKQNAAAAGVEPEDLRTEVISAIQKTARELAPLYPDAGTVGDALAAFVKAPGTLTITATPKGDLKVMDLIAADPLGSAANFKITATATP